jgi:hypothetical protein
VAIIRAPYILDRNHLSVIKELEPLRERSWRLLSESEKDKLTSRLAKLGSIRVGVGYNDKLDCSDLADDFTEVFQRAGWKQPLQPGVTYASIGAKGIAISGKAGSQLAPMIQRAIAETTYIHPGIGEQLPANAHVSERVNDKPIYYEIDVMLLVACNI